MASSAVSPAGRGSEPAPSGQTPEAPPSAVPLASARPASLEPPPLAAPGESAAEQRVFRQLMMGKLPATSRRLWTLLRGAGIVRLRTTCQGPTEQSGLMYGSITGREQDDALWSTTGWLDYVGTVVASGGERYRLARSAGGGEGCTGPEAIELRCAAASVAALAPRAALIPGNKRDDDTMRPARWQPPTRSAAPALRCLVALDAGEQEPFRFWLHPLVDPFPLLFTAPTAARPGVEWAFENSDMVVQEGAYRWMPGGGR